MKRFFVLALLLSGIMISRSSAQVFEKGTNIINAGIGIGGNYGNWGGASSSPQINISFEHGIWEVGGPGVISLGGYVGHKSYKLNAYDWKWNYTTIGVRGAYHYNGLNNPKIDLYGGLMLGYMIYNATGYSGGSGGTGFSAFAGARYLFTDNLGAYAELGGGNYNLSILSLGLALKF